MLSSTSTRCSIRRQARWGLVVASLLGLVALASAQDVELRVPSSVPAGQAASVTSSGSGRATFYLLGPSVAFKRDAQLGEQISLPAKELQTAGRYVALMCTDTCNSAAFFVVPAKPVSLTFVAHPSRAPVAVNDVISGVALPFDEFHNLVLAPQNIDFQMSTKGGTPMSHKVQTKNGIAWFRASSGKTAGPLQVQASIGDVNARRVVQQVASDPCRLRINGRRTAKGIEVETDPVRDCSGNPVPDGTIVTFTAKGDGETSTVDAPVKQDVARARITANGPVVISAASGVVMGNELRVGGK
jgi:hypothetical protein